MPFLIEDANQLELHPTFEIRTRYERRVERDFNSEASDNRSDFFTRVRPGVKLTYGPRWAFELQYQYSHDLAWTGAKNFSTENSDASLANIQYMADGWKLTAGRQRIAVGSQRLIGVSEWGNVNKSADGLRIQAGPWDLFGFEPSIALAAPINTRFYGVAYTGDLGLTMAVLKKDKTTAGETDIWTLDHQYAGRHWGWDWTAEGALQFGEILDKDIEAWALHFRASQPVNKTTKFFVEANAASGGGDSETTRTFDQLNASNHSKYGTMDLQGWRNMNELAFGFEAKPNAMWSWNASARWFSLRDPADAWYGDGGSANSGYLDPTGKSGRNVGMEIDFEGAYKQDSRTTWSAGLSLFNPGTFVQNIKGGHADVQAWGFVYFQFKY